MENKLSKIIFFFDSLYNRYTGANLLTEKKSPDHNYLFWKRNDFIDDDDRKVGKVFVCGESSTDLSHMCAHRDIDSF